MYTKKILCFLLIGILTSCSSDDNDPSIEETQEEAIIVLNATGNISEQTPEQAKKTINGKWNVGDSSSTSNKSNISCSFYGIEFTDDRFAMAFTINGTDTDGNNVDEEIYAYGTYSLIEDSSGNVTSVDLFELVEGENYKIASLTDVVVTENSGNLNAVFTVVFSLPEDFTDFPCGNLSGSYDADKESAIEGAEDAEENSNLVRLISGAWRLSNFSDSEGSTIEEAYLSPCEDLFEDIFEDKIAEFDASGEEITEVIIEQLEEEATQEALEECEPASEIEVSFSVYGTYIFSFSNDIGETILVEVDSWEFTDAGQTQILVDGEDILSIDTLNDTNLTVSQSYTEEGETYSATYTFDKVN